MAKFQYAALYCLLPRTICVQHLICRRQHLSCTGTAGYSAFASNFVINFHSADFSLTVKAATLIFISERGSAISSAKEGKSSFIYILVNS